MAFSLTSDMNLLKNMPAYKPLLKTVLKSQIQLLVEQLSEYGDEECMFLTASLTDGTLSYIGSKYGHSFLTKYKNIKGNFLKFCLEKNNDSNHVQHLTTGQSPGPPKEQRKVNKRQHIIKQPEPKRFKLESHDTDVSANELIADITVDTSPKQSKDNIDTSTSRLSEQSEKNKEKMKHQQETKIVKYSHEINGYEIGLKGSKENDEIQNCDNFDDTNNMNSFIVKVEPDWEANCEDVTINMEDKFNTESSARGTTNTENRYNRESSVSSENSLSCTDISSSYQNSRSGLKEAFLRPEFLCCNDRLIWEKNKLPKQKRVIKSVPLWKKYSAIKEVELKKKTKVMIAQEFNVPQSTLSTWLKHSEQIKADVEKEIIDPRKKKRRFSNFHDIETALLEWLKIVHLQAVIPKITSVNICDKAKQLAQQFGYTTETFKCSKGWVERFKARHGFDKNFVKGDNCNGE